MKGTHRNQMILPEEEEEEEEDTEESVDTTKRRRGGGGLGRRRGTQEEPIGMTWFTNNSTQQYTLMNTARRRRGGGRGYRGISCCFFSPSVGSSHGGIMAAGVHITGISASINYVEQYISHTLSTPLASSAAATNLQASFTWKTIASIGAIGNDQNKGSLSAESLS
ncbi:uncharacterized protein LOC126992219 isoform X1 [Eriocheir sinensis]|uniref:uncharacterized protein LOC126992219 isoform X1 n=1 Tax=Eriocheir sinensis TaxID=95602 RepID=UPI0021C9B596|nr:uncharacterized protein LOC126992219 isoform X1 [Eriocheir sinensis]